MANSTFCLGPAVVITSGCFIPFSLVTFSGFCLVKSALQDKTEFVILWRTNVTDIFVVLSFPQINCTPSIILYGKCQVNKHGKWEKEMVALVLDQKPAQNNIQSTSFYYDATLNTEVRKGRFKPAVADRNFFKMFIIKCFPTQYLPCECDYRM